VEEIDFDHSHISGGISKINTADNVFGIFTSRSMKERGKYQIQCMKSRSSTGVGQKIDLDYNIETMRITDPGVDENTSMFKKPASTVYESIKARSTVSNDADTAAGPPMVRAQPRVAEDVPRIDADIQSAKLKQLLGNIKSR
jgi:hypothetical protein